MRLNQVTVTVRDVARSIDFYQRLGLRMIVKSPHYARFVCPDGGSTFSVHVADEHETFVPSSATIYFECDDLDQRVKQLTANSIAFDSMPTDQPWLWREARLRDPDGNPICLYYAGENRLNPPWVIK
jgi:catechol 2,3-dioxygenase-like lactoylglutathione lyase family enzyme